MTDFQAETLVRGQDINPPTATLKRRLGARVRAMREKLTSSDTGYRNCDLALIGAYARNRIDFLPIDLGWIFLALWLAHEGVVTSLFLVWSLAALCGLTIRQLVARHLQNEADSKTPLLRRRARILLAEGLNGLIWASAIFPFLQTGRTAPVALVFLIILRAGVEAVANATVPLAVYAALGPTATGLVIDLLSVYSGQDATQLFTLFLLAHLFFLCVASRFHRQLADRLLLETRTYERIAVLEREKEIFDSARRGAEEASLAKSRFLATMSHELRTPLNAMLGFSEVLAGELYGPHENNAYREYARDILSSGQHLLTLINDLLDLSRIEVGRYELREQSLSLATVASECRHIFELRAKKKNITLIESMEKDLPPLWADLRALRQIIINLLANAIKYTPDGGVVTIKVGWTSIDGQYVSVRDTGPGIPEDEIVLVMASFGRGALAKKNPEDGAGLGLPIIKGLVELHEGEFFLNSQPLEGAQGGTEAVVVFPPQRVMNALPRYAPDTHAA
jgi:two-component system cell cycle sensor histidine kinase PleC